MALQEIHLETEDLVRRAREGSADAFATLVRSLRMSVLRTARALLRDHHEAEDVAQEAFVAAWRHLASLREPGSFRPWVFRILARIAARRRERTRPALLEEGTDRVPAPAADRDPRLDRLVREVRLLPDRFRVPLSLFYLGGLGYAEVTDATGTTTKAVRSRLHRARARLRERMEHEERRR